MLGAQSTFWTNGCKLEWKSASGTYMQELDSISDIFRWMQNNSLVLNITTRLVPLQFHLEFDNLFETVNQPGENHMVEWKTKCNFVTPPTILASKRPVSKGDPDQAPDIIGVGQHLESQPALSDPPPQIPSGLHHGEGKVSGDMEIDPECMEEEILEKEPVRWSWRQKTSLCLRESIEQRGLAFTSIFDDVDGDEEIRQQIMMSDHIAYTASSDPDTMYVVQAMKLPGHK